MKLKLLLLIFLCFVFNVHAAEPTVHDLHLTFVKTIIIQLSSLERLREQKATELKQNNNKIATEIRDSRLLKIELKNDIEKLHDLAIDHETELASSELIKRFNDQIKFYQEVDDCFSAMMLSGENLVQEVELDMRQRKLDEDLLSSITSVTSLLFDRGGNLLITKLERDQLIREIKTKFGFKLSDEKNLVVRFAYAILTFLNLDTSREHKP